MKKQTKVCTKCKTTKTRDEFYNNKNVKDGKSNACKACTLQGQKAWRSVNRESFDRAQRKWREANDGRTYTDKNSGYVIHIGYAHPATLPGGLTREHRIVLWDKLNGQDTYCHWQCGTFLRWDRSYPKRKDGLTVDHLNGVRDDNRPENLVASCHTCNASISKATRKPKATCGFDGCIKQAVGKGGLCSGHYEQMRAGRELTPLNRHLNAEQASELVYSIKCGETITAAAAEWGIQPSTASRIFKREVGISVMHYRATVLNLTQARQAEREEN